MTGVLLPHHSHTLPGGLRRESVWVQLKTPYDSEMFPSYPPPQQPTCVWEGCWVFQRPPMVSCVHVHHFSFVIPYKALALSKQSCVPITYVYIYTCICVPSYPLCKLCTAVVAGVHLHQTLTLGETKHHNVHIA